MTDDNREALEGIEELLKQVFSNSTGGGLLTDYFISIAGMSASGENETEYYVIKSHTPMHSVYGLAKIGIKHLEAGIESDLWADDNDE